MSSGGTRRPVLRSVQFRREREASWSELDRLLARLDKGGLASLGADEVARLPVLHRGLLASLSVARATSLDANLLEYLEGLAARSHVRVYARRRPARAALAAYLGREFPRLVRARWRELFVSGFALLAGMLTAYLLVQADQHLYWSFVPDGLAGGRDPASSTEDLRRTLTGGDEAGLHAFAAMLFTHNAQVGILAFALGFLAGVPSFLLVFYNGLVLGAFAALFQSRGLSVEMWAWLLPHGFTELGAVVLCGAAGLALGQALVFPGRTGRLAHLAERGRTAAALLPGAAAMLLVAAIFEGYFRQIVTDTAARYSVAVLLALGWIAYFALAGRGARREAPG